MNMKTNHEEIDEEKINHTNENGNAKMGFNFEQTIKLQQKYLEKSIRQLEQQAKRQISQRAAIINEVFELMRAAERFKREGFYNRKYVYLVSKKWLQLWKKYTNYDEIMQYKNLPPNLNQEPTVLDKMNAELIDTVFNPSINFTQQSKISHYNIALNPAIKQGQHYEYYSEQMWNILKHYKHQQIKRQIIQIKVNEHKEKIAQIFLQKFTVVLLTSKILRDIKNKKVEDLQYQTLQFSKFSPGAYFKYESNELILDSLNKDSLNQISFWNANLNYWIINPSWDASKLLSRIKKSIEHQQNVKRFSISLYGLELVDGSTLEQQINTDQPILVCEILDMNQKNICYNSKKFIKSDCPSCEKEQLQLRVPCKCKYIVYCSQECQKTDAKHRKKCPYFAKLALKIKEPELKINGLVGLTNLGNTCFMNSGIQCLSNIAQLTQYFITNEYVKDINTLNPLGTKGNLSNSYSQMMKNLWCQNSKTYSPHLFKRSVSAFQRMFSGYQQHDSGQFLTYLLDGLHEDLNRIKKKPYIQAKDQDDRPDKIIAQDQWKNFRLRNDSKIVELMYGQFRSQVDCPKCKYKSIQFDPFLMCSLPIPNISAQIRNEEISGNKLTIVFQKDNSKQQVVNCPYEQGQKMQRILEYLRCKFQLKDEKKLIIHSSKILINPDQKIAQIKNRFRHKIYVRMLSELQNINGCKIFVYLKEESTKNNQVIVSNLNQKLYCFNPEISLQQIHQLINNSQINLLKTYNFNNYYEMIKSKPFKERPIKIAIKQQMFNSCWNCKLNCRGCQFPYSKTKISEIFNANKRSSISLDLTIKKLQTSEKNNSASLNNNSNIINNNKNSNGRSQKQLTILNCFKSFEEPQILTKDNAWYCSKCKIRVQAKKQMMIYKCPKILIICLKRFKKRLYNTEKNSNFIDFPVSNLDLSQIVLNSKLPQTTNVCNQSEQTQHQKVLYDLFAVSYHMGDANSGHYTATCMNPYNKQWYHFDDERVTKIEESSVVSRSAYILFYRRKEKVQIYD